MNESPAFCYDTQTQFVSGRWRRSDALWCRGELRKTQGVMKGSDRDVLNGNVRPIYRKGRVAFTNSLNVDYTRAERERFL